MLVKFVSFVELESVIDRCRKENATVSVHALSTSSAGWEHSICGSHGNRHKLQKESGWCWVPGPTGCCGVLYLLVKRNSFLGG